MSANPTAIAQCALCGSNEPLCESHIVPHFVFNWFKDTSATGHIRFSDRPNLRVQDGKKESLLCAACETRLSAYEKHAAENIFKPYHENTSATVRYGAAFAPFCASVCWRVLFVMRREGLDHLTEQQKVAVEKALEAWRAFIFAERDNPGRFELHVYPIDICQSVQNLDVPANFNRYLARVLDCDVAANSESAFVYVKMGKLLLFGLVDEPYRNEWKGARVHMRGGKYEPGSYYYLPAALSNFLAGRAARVRELHDEMSTRQKGKIAESMGADLDRAANSEMFEAMRADVDMFGKSAFRKLGGVEPATKKSE